MKPSNLLLSPDGRLSINDFGLARMMEQPGMTMTGVPSCAEAGILGALTGVIGSIQALEVLKLIAVIGEPLIGRLLLYEGLSQRFETIRYKRKS